MISLSDPNNWLCDYNWLYSSNLNQSALLDWKLSVLFTNYFIVVADQT